MDPAARPPGTAPPADLRQRLLRFSHIFRAAVQEVLETRYLRETTARPLTLSQFHLLRLISRDGSHPVGEVASLLGVSPPAASKCVDKLERLHLVTRSPSQGDRRASLVTASPRGRDLVRRYEQLQEERLTPILGRFREDELRQFAALLERFSVLLYSHEEVREGTCLRCAGYLDQNCPLEPAVGGCAYPKIRPRGNAAPEEPEIP